VGNDIRDEGAEALAQALTENRHLQVLDLDFNEIHGGGAEALAQALRVNTTLTGLYLNSNFIGSDGATALADGLSVNTALTDLMLERNRITGEGVAVIFKALEVNTTIAELSLGDSEIGDERAKALAEVLKKNRTLTELHLWGNPIGDAGATALSEALDVNTDITELKLTYDQINQQIKTDIEAKLNRNKTIETIIESLLGGRKIVRMEERNKISIIDTDEKVTIYNKEDVELAIKSIAQYIEIDDKYTEIEKKHRKDFINKLKDSGQFNNIYLLTKIVNLRNSSGEKIFDDAQRDCFIEEYMKSDFIKSINDTLLSSRKIQQACGIRKENTEVNPSQPSLLVLPPEMITHIINQLLPPRISAIYDKKANDQKTSEGQEDENKAPETQDDQNKEAIVLFFKNFKPERRAVKPDPMVSSAVATTGSQKEGQELGRE
jgi:Ran GTPase-activating protein (RanGAP) involved in mRNA processing and transport